MGRLLFLLLISACLQVHVHNANNDNDGQHDQSGCTLALILLHQPDKKRYKRQQKNSKENYRRNAHIFKSPDDGKFVNPKVLQK